MFWATGVVFNDLGFIGLVSCHLYFGGKMPRN